MWLRVRLLNYRSDPPHICVTCQLCFSFHSVTLFYLSLCYYCNTLIAFLTTLRKNYLYQAYGKYMWQLICLIRIRLLLKEQVARSIIVSSKVGGIWLAISSFALVSCVGNFYFFILRIARFGCVPDLNYKHNKQPCMCLYHSYLQKTTLDFSHDQFFIVISLYF